MTSVTRAVLVAAALFVTLPIVAASETPLNHLNQAERMLNAIPGESLKKDGQKKIDELRRHFAELVDAYNTNGDSPLPAAAASDTDAADGETNGKPMNWKAKFSQVEKDLAAMLGGVPPLAPADLQRQLEQFRLEVELFFASATLDLESEGRSPQSAERTATND